MKKILCLLTFAAALLVFMPSQSVASTSIKASGNNACLCSPQLSRPRIRANIGDRGRTRRPLPTVRARYTCANSRVRYIRRGGARYRVIYRCCGYVRNGRVYNPRCRPLVQRA